MSITYKDAAGIAGMRTACRLASEVLDYLTPLIQPGVTTLEIDRLSAEYMKQQGTRSATVGYQPSGYPPYPGHLLAARIKHAPPDRDRRALQLGKYPQQTNTY